MSGGDPLRSLEALRAACGGAWLSPPARESAVRGASIDSRELAAGSVFFAHRGERTDGHRFVGGALRAGAAAAVVDDPLAVDAEAMRCGPILRVKSVTAAMVDLAWARRRAMGATVVGITGSSGKTTTTRLVEGVLSRRLRGFCSQKSHNNTLGVCLTLLNAPFDGEYLVSEVGTSAPGEIAALTDLLRPDIGIITSIGRAHVLGLGSIGGIAREKAALVNGLSGDGLALVAAGCAALDGAIETRARLVRVGVCESAEMRVDQVAMDRRGVRFRIGEAAFSAGAIGAHNAVNAAFAVAVGRTLGVDDRDIREGLLRAELPAMRLEVERLGGITVVNDAYNANPDSMLGAIDTLERLEHDGRRVAILGDMLELGETSDKAHREIGRRLAGGPISRAILVGPAMGEALVALAGSGVEAMRCEDAEAVDVSELRDGDLVLVKGSRGMRMERVVDAIRSRALEVRTRCGRPLARPA